MKFLLWIYVLTICTCGMLLGIPVAVITFCVGFKTDNFNLFENWTNFWWNLLQDPMEKLNKKDGF